MRHGIAQIVDVRRVPASNRFPWFAAERPTAVLCAEGDPTGCHRGLLSDWLELHGALVFHIRADDARRHRQTPSCRGDGDRLVYDLGQQRSLPTSGA